MRKLIDVVREAKDWNALPQINTIAYDYNGEAWVIDASIYADGGAPENCNSLKEFLRNYDWSGAMREYLNDDDANFNRILVGCHMKDDESEIAAWVWGDDGVHYTNKGR